MTKYHKKLVEIANRINENDFLTYKINVNRRYETYFVDKYDSEGRFHGAMSAGNYNEVKIFLTGLQYAFFYMKPF